MRKVKLESEGRFNLKLVEGVQNDGEEPGKGSGGGDAVTWCN